MPLYMVLQNGMPLLLLQHQHCLGIFFNAFNLSLYVKVAFPCFLSSSVQKITHTPYIGDNVHCTSKWVHNKLDVNISWPSMEYSIVSIDFDATSFLLQKYLVSFQRTSDAFDVIFFWWL